MIDDARRRGVDVTADCYPYDAWHSTITVLVPEQAIRRSGQRRRRRWTTSAARPTSRSIATKRTPSTSSGRSRRSRRSKQITPVELFIRIVKDGGASVIGKSMLDEDIRTFYQQPWVMVASDGGIGLRHPRSSGTFPRVLGRFVREQHWLTLPEAVRKMTSAPADRLHQQGPRPNCRRQGRRSRPASIRPPSPIDRLPTARDAGGRDHEGIRVRHSRVGRRHDGRPPGQNASALRSGSAERSRAASFESCTRSRQLESASPNDSAALPRRPRSAAPRIGANLNPCPLSPAATKSPRRDGS